MSRKKRPENPLLQVARRLMRERYPHLPKARLILRQLDGPPGSPRFAITAESCQSPIMPCKYGVTTEQATAGNCPIADCPLRHTTRLLYSREGELLQLTESTVHYRREPAKPE